MLNDFNLAVGVFTGDDMDSKYAVNQIQVEKDCTVATDGHALMVVSTVAPIAIEKPVLLDSVRSFDIKDGVLTCRTHANNSFPNWKGLFEQQGEPVGEVIFNADYLMKVLEVIQKHIDPDCSFGNKRYVRLRFFGPEKSLQIDAQNDEQGMTALLMPIRPGTTKFDLCYGDKKHGPILKVEGQEQK